VLINAADDILAGRVDGDRALLQIQPNMWFIPAYAPSSQRDLHSHAGIEVSDCVRKLRSYIDWLRREHDIEVVILDCHGGVDNISFAAFVVSDVTLVVTEADKVTFNGTLELMDFYFRSTLRTIGAADGVAEQRGASETVQLNSSAGEQQNANLHLKEAIDNLENNKVYFLVNRVRTRMDYDIFKKRLEEELFKNFSSLKKMLCGLAFMPSDTLAAKSFSEYPFYVELLPESILSQKLLLVCQQLLGAKIVWPTLRKKWSLYRLFEKKSDSFLERYVGSPEEDRSNSVFSYIAWTHIVLFAFVLGSVWFASATSRGGSPVVGPPLDSDAWLAGVAVLGFGLGLLYLAIFDRKVSSFFRDRLRYEVRLFRMNRRDADPFFGVNFLRLFFLRIVMLMWAGLFSLSAMLYIVMGAGWLVYAAIRSLSPA